MRIAYKKAGFLWNPARLLLVFNYSDAKTTLFRRNKCELFRLKKGNPVENGGATNQEGGKSGQKRVALQSINFDQAKAQKAKNTQAQKCIADVKFLHE